MPAGARGFRYHEPVLTILIVFIALSAVELVAVDLIVRRWPYVRIPLLVLSIWGLIWMLGFLFGMLTRPHAVGPESIRVRYGAEVDIEFRGPLSTRSPSVGTASKTGSPRSR